MTYPKFLFIKHSDGKCFLEIIYHEKCGLLNKTVYSAKDLEAHPEIFLYYADEPEVCQFIEEVNKLRKERKTNHSILDNVVKGLSSNNFDIAINYPDKNDRSLMVLNIYKKPVETWYVYKGDDGIKKYILNNTDKILENTDIAKYLPSNEVLAEVLKSRKCNTNNFKGKLVRDLLMMGDWGDFVGSELVPKVFDYVTMVDDVIFYFIRSK